MVLPVLPQLCQHKGGYKIDSSSSTNRRTNLSNGSSHVGGWVLAVICSNLPRNSNRDTTCYVFCEFQNNRLLLVIAGVRPLQDSAAKWKLTLIEATTTILRATTITEAFCSS